MTAVAPLPLTFGTLPGRAHLPAPEGGARVLLISTYELGHQPLGLAAAAAALRAAGHDVRTLDVAVEPLPAAAIRDVDLVAISVPMHTAARIGLQVAEAIREAGIEARIACFGLYASPLAGQLGRRGIEVIGGEYEAGLVALAGQVAARETGAFPGAGAKPSLARQRYLVPDRRGLPALDRYAQVRRADGQHLAGYAEATRGCAHTCRHCPITPVYGGALRLVQPEVVLADITQQVEAGAAHITFGDPDFLNAVPHSLAIIEEAHRRWPALSFDVTVKVEHLIEHAGALSRLRAAGVIWITSAFESCNDDILRRLDKGHDVADMRRALALTHAAGLPVRPTWVAFTPWTALDDIAAMFDFIAEQRLQRAVQSVQYGLRLLLPPGSPLNDLLAGEGRLGPFDETLLTYTWRSLDP
ncbi:MAG: radical SAM protein, partial [Dehalococcoidia bacterium]